MQSRSQSAPERALVGEHGTLPVVSVLMAAYNAAAYVDEAIDSVVRQSYGRWELLCVDDASKDKTADLVSAWCVRDDRVRLVQLHENRGQPTALNAGLAQAAGEFVAILDADDVAVEDRLERSLDAFVEDPGLGLVGSGTDVIDANGEVISRWTGEPLRDDAIKDSLFSRGNVFAHSSIMVRRELLELVGGYDADLLTSQDYDLYLRLAPVCRMALIAPPLVKWRSHSGQKSVQSRARQALMADFARRRALARAEGALFDDERELSLAQKRAGRPWHWLPGEAAGLYVRGRHHLQRQDTKEARQAFGQALRLCPGLLRALPFYVLTYLPARPARWLATLAPRLRWGA